MTAIVLLVPCLARAQEATGHRYVLEAHLDPEAHQVDGVARIRWVNESDVPADEIYLHLYLNAFASDDTVFMRGSGGESRGNESSGEGSIEVLSLEDAAGHDLLAGADDELIAGDHTQMRVPLPTAVPPGGDLEVETRFRSTLPPVFARSGYHGSFHTVAQWFPKIARRERDGTWRCFPYYSHGEFYADFARYELEVDVPEGWVVGATGALVEETRDGGRLLQRYVAEPVHDAAFVAYDLFEEQRFEAGGVAVRVLYPAGYDWSIPLHVRTTRDGLARYGRLLGEYPYEHLTVVVPPRGADGAAGMEYPTLFLTAGPPYPLPHLPLGAEGTTAHELGHQWFQGLVATDEVRFPFLDEGLTQWLTGDLLRARHGSRRSGVAWPAPIDFFQIMRAASYIGDDDLPPASAASDFHGSEYGRSVYARTSSVLETVRRTWGRPRFERALGDYARRHRFSHPTPEDLYETFDRHYYRGFSDGVLVPALEDGDGADLKIRRFASRAEGDGYVTDLVVTRRGAARIPTWLELRRQDGTRERLPLRAGEDTFEIRRESDAKVVAAYVDPDGHDLLDPTFADRFRGEGQKRSAFGFLLHLAQLFASWVAP
jgi:hypothetical protein